MSDDGVKSGLMFPENPVLKTWNDPLPTVGSNIFATDANDAQKAQFLASLAGGWAYQQIAFFVTLMSIVLGWFSVSVEVFLRHSFGERYLSLLRLFMSWIALSFFATGGQIMALVGVGTSNTDRGALSALGGFAFFQVLYWVFIGMSIWHLWRISQRNRRGERWHSWSFGISWLNGLIGRKIGPVVIDDWSLYRFVEPVLVLVLAFVFGIFSGVVAVWFFVASVTLFIKNNYLYSQSRGRMLDMIDAQIASDYFQAALQGQDKRQTAGFVMVRPPRALDRNQDGIPDPLQAPQTVDFSRTLNETVGEVRSNNTGVGETKS